MSKIQKTPRINPRERLDRGREFAIQGLYSKALREYVWFHNHALKHDSSFYGVRLSYALHDWVTLGQSYPEALRVLAEIRNLKAQLLANGKHDFHLFHDVASINNYLDSETQTCRVFRRLSRISPEFARRCAPIVLPTLVKNGEYRLAYRQYKSAEDALLEFSDLLNRRVEMMKHLPPSKAPRLHAYCSIYSDEIQTLHKVLRGVGKHEEATYVMLWTVALITAARARQRILKIQLERSPDLF